MEQLDGLATRIGQATCHFLSGTGHDTVDRILCSDGYYSAGWKMLVVALVVAGVLAGWLGMGRPIGRNL